jgi:hypothetical protein
MDERIVDSKMNTTLLLETSKLAPGAIEKTIHLQSLFSLLP